MTSAKVNASRINLNDLVMKDGGHEEERELTIRYRNDRKKPIVTNETTVYFDDIKSNLIREIKKSKAVVGCVAWLTDFEILAALATVPFVVICIQKEDFLRPDLGVQTSDRGWRLKLRQAYSKLSHRGLTRYSFPPILSDAGTNGDIEFNSPVVCVGNYNRDKDPAFPRMHNKFLVMSDKVIFDNTPAMGYYGDGHPDYVEDEKDIDPDCIGQPRERGFGTVEPTRVWTGSFNFTQNAGRSFENALLLTNPEIVQAYFKEWQYIMMFSENLNWHSDWSAPELRIGT